MKFYTAFPATLISHRNIRTGKLIAFGTTDMHGILEVSDDDKYIGFLKGKFRIVSEETAEPDKTNGQESKSNATPYSGDNDNETQDVEEGMNKDGDYKRGSRANPHFIWTSKTGSNAHGNGAKSSGRGTKKSRAR